MSVSSVRRAGVLPDGRAVQHIELGSTPGVVLSVLDLGATVASLEVPGGDGRRHNVVLGHADVADYVRSDAHLGATIGRYANRIAGGTFELDGKTVQVPVNDRGNALHGGPDGFDKRLWEIEAVDTDHAVLRLTSPDGDQGFPGTVEVRTRYDVSDTAVRITMTAQTDAPTVVNLTNHAYFTLDGLGSGSIDDHVLTVPADRYTPVDETGIPLGGHLEVDGTPLDLRQPTRLGERIRAAHPQVLAAGGLDHTLLPRGEGLRPVARLKASRSGIELEVHADQPGLQVYTGNSLTSAIRLVGGRCCRQGDGIALEPGLPPDTPNRPWFGSAELQPGETYRETIEWQFSADVTPSPAAARRSG